MNTQALLSRIKRLEGIAVQSADPIYFFWDSFAMGREEADAAAEQLRQGQDQPVFIMPKELSEDEWVAACQQL